MRELRWAKIALGNPAIEPTFFRQDCLKQPRQANQLVRCPGGVGPVENNMINLVITQHKINLTIRTVIELTSWERVGWSLLTNFNFAAAHQKKL